LLKAEGLGRRYGSTLALDHVSFEVIEGEFFKLLGPSGCGKSTTLRLIAGLEEPGAGEIPGVVVDVSYIGSRYECAVSAANTEFVLETAPHLKPQPRQRVMLRLNEMKFWPA